MRFIIFPEFGNGRADSGEGLLFPALATEIVGHIVIRALTFNGFGCGRSRTPVIISRERAIAAGTGKIYKVAFDPDGFTIPIGCIPKLRSMSDWLVISNGRYFTRSEILGVSNRHEWKLFHGSTTDGNHSLRRHMHSADVIALTVHEDLRPYREAVMVTSEGLVAGFRRHHLGVILPAPIPADWPHYLLINASVLRGLTASEGLPLRFDDFIARCRDRQLRIKSLAVGGNVFDLDTRAGLLRLVNDTLNSKDAGFRPGGKAGEISPGARVFGEVILGRGAAICPGALVAGPAIICSKAMIGKNAIVKQSIIGPEVKVPEGQALQGQVLLNGGHRGADSTCDLAEVQLDFSLDNWPARCPYRRWPRFSYAAFTKRILDIATSLMVLSLFAPFFPIIALCILASSSGPVFFKDKREGRYGRQFHCIKFRTMISGAADIQDSLRFKNEVDGPQFKVENDPRITAVGRFLRDTFLDEIPQFINILIGQMSVIGPRPSPRSENAMCPVWRDARLSVRPGITGLWQINRTRRPGQDFQEWIHFDTEYIRKLSFWADVKIFLRTALKMAAGFIEKF